MKRKLPSILMLIIALSCIGTGAYLTLNLKETTKEETKEEEKKEENEETDNKEQPTDPFSVQELNITDKLVTDLYNKVQLKEQRFEVYYLQDKILANDLDMKEKLKLTIQSMNISNDRINPTFEESEIEKAYHQLFGPESTYQFETVDGDVCPQIIKTEDGKIQVVNQCNLTYKETTQRKLYQARKLGTELYIYEIVGFHKYKEGTNTTDLFKNQQRTELAIEHAYTGENPLEYDLLQNISNLPQYKYTFKQDKEKNYYLYSIEKVQTL